MSDIKYFTLTCNQCGRRTAGNAYDVPEGTVRVETCCPNCAIGGKGGEYYFGEDGKQIFDQATERSANV